MIKLTPILLVSFLIGGNGYAQYKLFTDPHPNVYLTDPPPTIKNNINTPTDPPPTGQSTDPPPTNPGVQDELIDAFGGVNFNLLNVTFTSSNLPILIIQTENNQTIPDDPKIKAQLSIIYKGNGLRNNITDTVFHYKGTIGIELRGNSSQNFPKKPYNFETRDSAGAGIDVPLLGMPADNDWVLNASYLDHTFARNILASHMSLSAGRWASSCRLVEVVLNGNYQGLYVLMEKIKRTKNRLNIAKLNPDEIYEPDITGGYIFEITGFENNFGSSRNLKYPEYADAAPEQIAYIKQYDDNFRNVMASANYMDPTTGYNAWIDVGSFVDELIVQEAMRNSDAYGWSGYFHKDKGGKLKAGPVWDFDQSAGNSSYPDNGVITGWLFSHPSTSNTPFFWPLLFEDPVFAYKVKLRWLELRSGPYQTNTLLAKIDSIASLLSEAQAREFAQWQVLGKYIWRETNGYQQRNTYQKEIDYLKSFLTQRWNWIDSELAKVNTPTTLSPVSFASLNISEMQVYPNPVKERATFGFRSVKPSTVEIYLYNSVGILVQKSQVYDANSGENKLTLELDNKIRAGAYVYKVLINNVEGFTGRLIKIN
jgi:spore coat protein CotH